MIVLQDDKTEIGIYPGRCIEEKNLKTQTERSIKWSEVKKSNMLRHLTENLMSRLIYELNGFSGMIREFQRIEDEPQIHSKTELPEKKPEAIMTKPTQKLFLNANEVEELYGFKTQTLANWRFNCIGPKYHKVGRSVRYKVEDLEEFLEAKKIRTEF